MQALCGLLCCIRPRKESPDPPDRPRAPNYPAPRPSNYLHQPRFHRHSTDSECSSSSWSTYSPPRPRPAEFRAAPRPGGTPSPPGTSSQTTILPENLHQATASEYASSLPHLRQRNNSAASEPATVSAARESAVIEPAAWLSSSAPTAGSTHSVTDIHGRLRSIFSDAADRTRSMQMPFRRRAGAEPELGSRPVLRKESRVAKAANGRRARGWSDPGLWAFYHFPDIARLPGEEFGGSSEEDESEPDLEMIGVAVTAEDGEKNQDVQGEVGELKEERVGAEKDDIKENPQAENTSVDGKLHDQKNEKHAQRSNDKSCQTHDDDDDSDKENVNPRASIARASWAPTLLSYWSSTSSTAVEASEHNTFNHSSLSYPHRRHEELYANHPLPTVTKKPLNRPLSGQTVRSRCTPRNSDETPPIQSKSRKRTLKASKSESELANAAVSDARKNSLPDVELDTFLAGAVATAVKDGKGGKKQAKKAHAWKEAAVETVSEAVKGRLNGNSTTARTNSKIPVPKGRGKYGTTLEVPEVARK